MKDGHITAEGLYRAYGEFTDFKNFQGNPMPEWGDLPERIQGAWQAVADSAIGTAVCAVKKAEVHGRSRLSSIDGRALYAAYTRTVDTLGGHASWEELPSRVQVGWDEAARVAVTAAHTEEPRDPLGDYMEGPCVFPVMGPPVGVDVVLSHQESLYRLAQRGGSILGTFFESGGNWVGDVVASGAWPRADDRSARVKGSLHDVVSAILGYLDEPLIEATVRAVERLEGKRPPR
jgi:hypothetical protein